MGKKYIPEVLSEEQTRIRLALKNLLVKRATRELTDPHYYVERRICKQMGLPLPEKTPDVKAWEMEKALKEGMDFLRVDF